MAIKDVTVTLGLPFGLGGISGSWSPDEEERKAAWEMYVELVTRVGIQELRPEEGLLREALSSLYTLFQTTRRILYRYGPRVAAPAEGTLWARLAIFAGGFTNPGTVTVTSGLWDGFSTLLGTNDNFWITTTNSFYSKLLRTCFHWEMTNVHSLRSVISRSAAASSTTSTILSTTGLMWFAGG